MLYKNIFLLVLYLPQYELPINYRQLKTVDLFILQIEQTFIQTYAYATITFCVVKNSMSVLLIKLLNKHGNFEMYINQLTYIKKFHMI